MPNLLEREDELRQGERLLERAREGEGGLLFVEGSAGAGKTSVLAALRERG